MSCDKVSKSPLTSCMDDSFRDPFPVEGGVLIDKLYVKKGLDKIPTGDGVEGERGCVRGEWVPGGIRRP